MCRLRLMSQNQWNLTNNRPYWEERGLDCSSQVRMKGHARVLQELMPDIVGGQEVNMQMQLDLKLNCMELGLPYTILWGNMTPIIYRADRLELLDTEYMLYPVNEEGYDGTFNDSNSKSANLAVFRLKANGEIFIFLTTHLWWKVGNDPSSPYYQKGSDVVRVRQIKMALDLIDKYQQKYNGCPVFMVGDLNSCYHTKAVQYALQQRGYSHAHDVATEFAHEGKGMNPCGPARIGPWEDGAFEDAIDHILVRDFSNLTVRRFDRHMPEYYIYLSDHAPVFADVEFQAKSEN